VRAPCLMRIVTQFDVEIKRLTAPDAQIQLL
jgi:hypothetical protein